MKTTLSVCIDTETSKQLDALAKRSRRSRSFLAAEAIAAFVEAQSWRLDEIQAGLKELDAGRGVAHQMYPHGFDPGVGSVGERHLARDNPMAASLVADHRSDARARPL